MHPLTGITTKNRWTFVAVQDFCDLAISLDSSMPSSFYFIVLHNQNADGFGIAMSHRKAGSSHGDAGGNECSKFTCPNVQFMGHACALHVDAQLLQLAGPVPVRFRVVSQQNGIKVSKAVKFILYLMSCGHALHKCTRAMGPSLGLYCYAW